MLTLTTSMRMELENTISLQVFESIAVAVVVLLDPLVKIIPESVGVEGLVIDRIRIRLYIIYEKVPLLLKRRCQALKT
jgi:hypothetical protein